MLRVSSLVCTTIMVLDLGFLFLAGAAMETLESADGKAALWWMFAAYLLHVVGELSISPVALSFITKMAPAKYASFMMGAYFFVNGIGNKVAGLLGESASDFGEFAIFTGIGIFCTIFGLLVIMVLKPLKRLTHGAEELEGSKHDETEGFELADE